MLSELESRLTRGEPFSAADAERVLESADLVSIGVIAETARQKRTGSRVTFARVAVVEGNEAIGPVEDAGEIRLAGTPASVDDARARVRAAAASGASVLTAFTLADLDRLAGGVAQQLGALARQLVDDGLVALAEVRLDDAASDSALIEALRRVTDAGLGAWRWTVGQGDVRERMTLIERAVAAQAATGVARALAPLPRIDRPDAPSTGYDDVKTIAIARLRCDAIEHIQVDWPIYGPKLAQVAIAFGANDIDGVSHVDTLGLGPRRTPLEDIRRQIQAAGGVAVERDARYAARS